MIMKENVKVKVIENIVLHLDILKGSKVVPLKNFVPYSVVSPSVAFISGRALRAPHDFSCEESRRASLTLISLLLRS